jgi:hypothetical protein
VHCAVSGIGFACTHQCVVLCVVSGLPVRTSVLCCTRYRVCLFAPVLCAVRGSGFACRHQCIVLYAVVGLPVGTSVLCCTRYRVCLYAAVCCAVHGIGFVCTIRSLYLTLNFQSARAAPYSILGLAVACADRIQR